MAMVRLLANEHVWTGAFVGEGGEILTTSNALGRAPMVNYILANGTSGEAWVVGRDDSAGLALLRPLVETPPYEFIQLSPDAPTIGDGLTLLQHSAFSNAIDQRPTSVSGYKPGILGYNYMQINAADNATSDGAMLIDRFGRVQGIRMPSEWLLRHQIANPNEVYAVDAAQVGAVAVPSLRAGRYQVDARPQPGEIGTIPPIPIIFNGQITIDGADATPGTPIYARLRKAGERDHWIDDTVEDLGFYILNVSAPSNSYDGAIVEFWTNGRIAEQKGNYSFQPQGEQVRLDLAF